MTIYVWGAVGVVILTLAALIRRFDTKLVLLIAGLAMCCLSMHPMAAFEQFDKSMTNSALIISICSSMGFAACVTMTKCDPAPRLASHEAAQQARHSAAALLHDRHGHRLGRHRLPGGPVRRHRSHARGPHDPRGVPPGHGRRRHHLVDAAQLLVARLHRQHLRCEARRHARHGHGHVRCAPRRSFSPRFPSSSS